MGKRNYFALLAAVVLSIAAPISAQETEEHRIDGNLHGSTRWHAAG